VLASCIIKEQQQIWHVLTKKKAQSSKSNGTSSAVLMEEGLPGKKRSPTESNDSPRSFLMSSSSLSRLTPLTTLSDFVALDPDLTPTAPPFGKPAAAVVVVMSLTVTAALFLRKRIPFRLRLPLDCAESCTGASRDRAARGGEIPTPEVWFSAGCGPRLASPWTCLRLRTRLSIWARLLRAAAWEPCWEDDRCLTGEGERGWSWTQ